VTDLAHSRADLAGALPQLQGPVGLVPTLGALHDGHRALIKQARLVSQSVVVSIFVNPLQFAPTEDLARYPRTLDADLEMCAAEGVDLVSGAMGVLGEIPGVKHYGGAAIAGVEHYVTKSFVDDYENPFAHPLETITSFAVSPAAATTAIAAGAVHDSVGVISKVGGGAIHEGGKLLSKIGGLF